MQLDHSDLKAHLVIWASTRENLSSVFANNKGTEHPVSSLISAFVIRFWKVSYLNLLQANFQITS